MRRKKTRNQTTVDSDELWPQISCTTSFGSVRSQKESDWDRSRIGRKGENNQRERERAFREREREAGERREKALPYLSRDEGWMMTDEIAVVSIWWGWEVLLPHPSDQVLTKEKKERSERREVRMKEMLSLSFSLSPYRINSSHNIHVGLFDSFFSFSLFSLYHFHFLELSEFVCR